MQRAKYGRTCITVYHRVAPNGKVAYVKVTLRADGSIVIQFKEK